MLDLRWPLGRTGLTALLRGSLSAPRSARRSPSFGLLAAASQADVKRWIQLLEVAGALQPFESEDGFRLLRAIPNADVPAIGKAASTRPADEGLFERLRAWRLERSKADGVPAFVVLSDKHLDGIAERHPTSMAELRACPGIGPAKLDSYGDEILEVLSGLSA